MYKTTIALIVVPIWLAIVATSVTAQQAPNADCKAKTAEWAKCVINQQLSRGGE
jgi:hypothetical protein